MGHGLGLQLTEWPSLMKGQHIKLESGMVLTLEPGLQLKDNNSLVHEENFIVTEEGGELLNERAPKEMVHIDR